MENNPKWKFPSTNGGNISGLNETGITQFKSIPIQSVTKETLQDSLDAKYSVNKPAVVKFSVFNVSREQIPDVDGLTNIFEKGATYWKNHEESKAFFEVGKEILSKEEIKIMRISDYNTVGLSKINADIKSGSTGGWLALVRSTGVTEKGPDSSGSFGIGKHAPFAASIVQTILYGSKNIEGEYGFQGVSKIASFKDEDEEISQGTGYFGIVKDNDFKPIIDSSKVPEVFQRTEIGTDKFIVGVDIDDTFDWEFEVLKEAISSFMLAILENKLEIHIGNFILNKNSLEEAIKKIKEREPKNVLIEFYQAITSSEKKYSISKFQTPSGDFEEIELHLLACEGFQKKVVLYRGTGMQIFIKGHFRTPIEFAGVLSVKGPTLNAILRKMEPPTHDKWDYNLYKDGVKYGKKLLKDINSWLIKETKELIDLSDVESVELKGLENLLPDISQRESSIIELSKKQTQLKIKSVKKLKQKSLNPTKKGSHGDDEKGIIPGKPKKDGDKDGGHNGGGKSGDNKRRSRLARIKRIAPYCINEKEGLYVLRAWPSTDGERTFSLKSNGEDNKTIDIEILNATLKNGDLIAFNKNEIGPIDFAKKELVEITVKIKSRNKLAIEVHAN